MSKIPDNLKYTKEHEWVQVLEPGKVRVGITDFAQSALGDIVYVQLPKNGDKVTANMVFAEVESTKSVSEIFAPLSGEIFAVNELLNQIPESINQDPYGNGWIVEISLDNPDSQLSSSDLLAPGDYSNLIS